MKKQNNISKVIYKLLCITLACTIFNACVDEEIISSTNVEAGIPVEVQLGMSIPGMNKVSTRALDEAAESQVNDLYVLVFDANSQAKKTGKFYSTDEIVSTTSNKNKGSITLETTSGECRIYAVANVSTTELNGTNIKSQLDNVTKISDLDKIIASLPEANIQRVQAALSMSGVYKTNNSSNSAEGYCVIDGKGNVSQGKIELERLDSHITFKIEVGPAVTSFTPISWQVKNIPLKSTIFQQTPSTFTQDGDFAESSISKAFGTDNIYRTFDFYMLENLKSAKEHNGESIAKDVSGMSTQEKQAEYAKREAEEKEIDKNNKDKVINTGKYKFSEPYATFVEIKATMEIAHSENGKDVTRVANVTYVIHLGGGTDDPANFASKRNTKYTYMMKINNVDNIVVEVKEDKENRPGEEGDVIDAEAEVRTLDAHYNSFVMGFSYNDVMDEKGNKALQFVVKTPFGTVTNKDIPDPANVDKPQDYHWIHFKRNGNGRYERNKLGLHNGDILDIFELGDDVIKRYNNDYSRDKTESKLYYYTVFVDEYYYNKVPKGQDWGNDPSTYWRHFANADDRYIMLVYAPKYSADNESSYAKARYMLTQRSIQTYYSEESDVALGMEHTNETGAVPYSKWVDINDATSYNGLWNTWQYLKDRPSWNIHVDRTSWVENMNTFATKSDAATIAHCLSRNRDENGDGIITADEVKWYLPTSEQLMGMFLGAKSLPSPLIDSENINFVYSERGDYHYPTSDKKRIWSEEGASVGELGVGHGAGDARNFRCVRNLGIDVKERSDITKGNYPSQAFEFKGEEDVRVKVYNKNTSTDEIANKKRIFVMTKLTEQNIRTRTKFGELAMHNNFDDGNKPAYAFQMAEKQTDRGQGITDPLTITTWERVIRSSWYDYNRWDGYYQTFDRTDRSWCKDYTEEKDGKDKGLWRAPNQREMMLMYINNKSNVEKTLSRTLWKYKTGAELGGYTRFFCTVGNLSLSNDGENNSSDERMGSLAIRCVRDVEIVK